MYEKKSINLFVPGRLCIIGEHSDWSSIYKTFNPSISSGYAIVTGIEQGIYAKVSTDSKFIFTSDIELYKESCFECEMDSITLKKEASKGSFFSYVTGVASYIKENYDVGGLSIEVTKMDLPIKSGLSSSAAICVLVTRAFNILYDLHLSTEGEMFIAYMGEQRTPSRCGRLDQACAFGKRLTLMQFDGNEISYKKIHLKETLYFVISDINGKKDTIKILADLNHCFPFSTNENEKRVQEAFGIDNEQFVKKAVKLLENGENSKFGELLKDYQKNFDTKVAPVSPVELKSPILHSLLENKIIRNSSFGAKGVGSQGDGSIQILAKDEKSQKQIYNYLKTEYNLTPYLLTITPSNTISKAIIPVAGYGTRMFPATKVIKKDLLPVVDKDGLVKPALLILIEQLLASGINDIYLVIGQNEVPIYNQLFGPLPTEYFNSLPENKKQYQLHLEKIQKNIHFVVQKEKKGLGHALFQCEKYIQEEPFLLLLGDMIYSTTSTTSCCLQIINLFKKFEESVISLHTTKLSEVKNYGILTGTWLDKKESIMNISRIIEKPSLELAKSQLRTKWKDSNENYFSIFGIYAFTKEIFNELQFLINKNTSDEEIQLTTAIQNLLFKRNIYGYVVNGKSFDIGLPQEYKNTIIHF